jgi:hypothetical protein
VANRGPLIASAVFLLLIAACDGSGRHGRSRVRDSAGIAIVENDSIEPGSQPWRVDSVPEVIIPARLDGVVRFQNVRAAYRLSDGRFVVASEGTSQIVFFDQKGVFIKAVGKKGSGVADFFQVYDMMRWPGESLAVDNLNDMKIFDDHGNFGRTIRFPSYQELQMAYRIGVTGSGAIIGGHQPYHESEQRRITRDLTVFIRASDSAPFRLIDSVPGVEVANSVRPFGQLTVVFGAVVKTAVGKDGYCLGYPKTYEIGCYDVSGKLIRLIRRRATPRAVTPSDVDRYRQGYEAVIEMQADSARREYMRTYSRAKVFADTLPVFGKMKMDRLDYLWVRDVSLLDEPLMVEEYQGTAASLATMGIEVRPAASVWSIFDPDGRWVGDVTMPANTIPLDIGRDYIVAGARDRQHHEAIHLYRLTR